MTAASLGASELLFNHIWMVPYYIVMGDLDRLLTYPRQFPLFPPGDPSRTSRFWQPGHGFHLGDHNPLPHPCPLVRLVPSAVPGIGRLLDLHFGSRYRREYFLPVYRPHFHALDDSPYLAPGHALAVEHLSLVVPVRSFGVHTLRCLQLSSGRIGVGQGVAALALSGRAIGLFCLRRFRPEGLAMGHQPIRKHRVLNAKAPRRSCLAAGLAQCDTTTDSST